MATREDSNFFLTRGESDWDASTTRCNGNGVDLMRNSPTRAGKDVSYLVGRQNFSRHLPWYMGDGK